MTCLSASMDGQFIVSGGKDSLVKVWHISSRKCVRSFEFKGEFTVLLSEYVCDNDFVELAITTVGIYKPSRAGNLFRLFNAQVSWALFFFSCIRVGVN